MWNAFLLGFDHITVSLGYLSVNEDGWDFLYSEKDKTQYLKLGGIV